MPDFLVVNASPLIVLAKIGALNLLLDGSAEVLIPDIVATEVRSGPDSDAARQALEAGWGRVVVTGDIPPNAQALGLDPGETAVIAVALAQGECVDVLDDGRARKQARSLGLTVVGTLGVILRAKKEARIPSANAMLKRVKAAGLYLDDALIQAVMATVDETWP